MFIAPRAMDVLAYLASYPAQVVSQQTLFDALWPDTTFSSGAVQRCIAQLRKALGDDAKNPKFIVTRPKRGYSLDVAPQLVSTTQNKPWLWSMIATAVVIAIYIAYLNY